MNSCSRCLVVLFLITFHGAFGCDSNSKPVIRSFAPLYSGNALNEGNRLTWEVTGAKFVSIDSGIGAVTGTSVDIIATEMGTFTYTLMAENDYGTSTSTATVVVWSATVGLDADRPPFLTQTNGGFKQAWAGGGWWPEQLFWEDVSFYNDHLNDAVIDAESIEASGTPPSIGCVSWGFDLLAADGGSESDGIADYSEKDGFKQYAAWMNPRSQDYFALDEQGEPAYPNQGYVSFGMPMLEADAEFPGQTFGQWAGARVGKLALNIHCRALSGADGFIGLNYFTDWHPRLIAAFEEQSGIAVEGATVADKHDWIMQNCPSQWWDFQARNQSLFFTTFGQTLLDAGKTPRVGGQWPSVPGIARFFGDDPRIWAENLDPSYLLFYVEVQSAGDRDTPPQWTAVSALGSTAARTPDVPIGAFLDADIQDYWDAVTRAGLTRLEGEKFLKHEWLSAAWTHLANKDGSVRRAAQVLVRSFWDAGGVDPNVVQTYLDHIPRHPFGPAIYYSVPIERSFEQPVPEGVELPTYYSHSTWFIDSLKTPPADNVDEHIGALQGLNVGYWMSDAVDPSFLAEEDKPSAWIVYFADRLSDEERAALQTVAPVIDPWDDPSAVMAAGPVRADGPGLNCLAFVDQKGSVIVMVSNINNNDSAGSLKFTNVNDGTFACNGLLGTPDSALTVTDSTGSLPVEVAGRDTLVFEIQHLKQKGL
jgi:hypothetical protein